MPRTPKQQNISDNQLFGNTPNNKPFQGAEMPQQNVSNDVGREAARQIRESRQQFPRQIERPDASSTSRQQLQEAQARQQGLNADAQRQLQQPRQPQGQGQQPTTASKEMLQQQMSRQQALQADAQRQVAARSRTNPSSPKPIGKPNNGMVAYIENGSARIGSTSRVGKAVGGGVRSGLIGAAIQVGIEAIPEETRESFGNWVWDNTLGWVINETFGLEHTPIAELKKRDAYRREYTEQMNQQDEYNSAQQQRIKKLMETPIGEGEAPAAPVLPEPEFSDDAPTPTASAPAPQPKQRIQIKKKYSAETDSRNAEYIAARNALNENSTQEDYDRVRDLGLAIHKGIYG